MQVTIKYEKNHDHIVGQEFVEEFDLNSEYEKREAYHMISNAITESKIFREGELEYPEEEQEMLAFKEGSYHLNVGDFSYVITIE